VISPALEGLVSAVALLARAKRADGLRDLAAEILAGDYAHETVEALARLASVCFAPELLDELAGIVAALVIVEP